MIQSDRMAAIDANAEALGVPRKQLMESSGNAVAREVRDIAERGDSVVLVAGRGNNGGDAFVAARFLDEYDVTTVLLGRADTIGTEIARENWEALQRVECDTRQFTDSVAVDIPDCDVIVDGMLGTGATGALREPEATAARAINESDATVVAVDVPSGVDADTGETNGVAVDADRVVTFHDRKPGLAGLDAAVRIADIGIPDAAELFVERGDLLALSRDPQSHKGDHGEVLVVGGGPYTGAPALSAQAALRAGADLVRVAAPETVVREIQGYEESLIVRELPGDRVQPGHVDRLLELAADHDAVVFGPGLGHAEETNAAAREFLSAYDGTCVVDANPLREVPKVDTDADLICTPHQGELESMGGETADDWRERMSLVENYADELDVTLLVKGAHDIISDGEETRVGRTGNPGMTVGGTGDVLAGITGALASGHDTLTAAGIAAFVNGRAGDLAVGDREYGILPTDLLDRIPPAMWGDDE